MNAIFTSRSHRFDSSEANPQNEGRRHHGFFIQNFIWNPVIIYATPSH